MKVGTDGVLLGAWTNIKKSDRVLDIGCGSGLIALMLAQRGGELIEAIDIEKNAFLQSKTNFENSKWHDKLIAHHISLSDFVRRKKVTYDLIVSNPPYFQSNKPTDARTIARSQLTLTYENLIKNSITLMELNSRLCLVLPFEDYEKVQHIAKRQGLFGMNYCIIKGTINSQAKRLLIEFGFSNKSPKEIVLSIEKNERHQYTEEYKALLKNYLTIF